MQVFVYFPFQFAAKIVVVVVVVVVQDFQGGLKLSRSSRDINSRSSTQELQ